MRAWRVRAEIPQTGGSGACHRISHNTSRGAAGAQKTLDWTMGKGADEHMLQLQDLVQEQGLYFIPVTLLFLAFPRKRYLVDQ